MTRNWVTYLGGMGNDTNYYCAGEQGLLHTIGASTSPNFPVLNPVRNITFNNVTRVNYLSTFDSQGIVVILLLNKIGNLILSSAISNQPNGTIVSLTSGRGKGKCNSIVATQNSQILMSGFSTDNSLELANTLQYFQGGQDAFFVRMGIVQVTSGTIIHCYLIVRLCNNCSPA